QRREDRRPALGPGDDRGLGQADGQENRRPVARGVPATGLDLAVAPVLRGEGGADPGARSLPVQDAFAVPFVQAERRSVAILAHSFITFSASPHCHCAAVSMEPPPMRRSTPAARSSPLVESVSLNSACAPPTNG